MPKAGPGVRASEQLIDAGYALALEAGLGAVTARALAERAGMAASALNYHLGGRDALLREIHVRACAASEAWRRQAAEPAPDAAAWLSPLGGLVGLIEDRASAGRAVSLLLAELETWVEASDDPRLVEAQRAETLAMTAFWEAAALREGAAEPAAGVWADLALGLVQLFLAPEPAAARLPWIVEAATRLHTRVGGGPVAPLPDRAAGAVERLEAAAPEADGARRLVSAAIDILETRGIDGLNLRDVAAGAGLSLAATTYFFDTKARLVAAAFGELHRRIRRQVLEQNEPALIAGPAVIAEGPRLAPRPRAMQALQLAGARDPTLGAIARELRATRGATSLSWLRSLGVEADRLDAFVFSTVMSGAIQRARHDPSGDLAAVMAEREAVALQVLFGVARPA